MNCERIESLLPVFMEKDLSPDEGREVEAHLVSCDACRESLAALEWIEGALLARRNEVPPVHRTTRAVLVRIRPRRLKRFIDTVYSLPSLISLSFFTIGAILFVYRHHIQKLFVGDNSYTSVIDALSRGGEWLTSMIVNTAGSDVWVLTGMYVGLTVLILLGTGMLLRNFVRDGR